MAQLPTNLKWAVAGRSRKKLELQVDKLKAMNNDRLVPGIEIVELEQGELDTLARKTRLIINGIGPYHLHSSPVIEACAKMGTHYFGFSLETPWVEEMIKKYHALASKTGAIIIPTIALAPSDVVAFLVAKAIHEQPHSKGTMEVNSTAVLELQGMSGGSLNTVMSLMSTYGLSWILPGNPWSLTQLPKPVGISKTPTSSQIFGYKYIRGFGICMTSFLAICNELIAHRSAILLPEVYGPRFHLQEFTPASNIFTAVLLHVITRLGQLMLALGPVRALLQLFIHAPGTGPDLAKTHVEKQTFRAIGNPANDTGNRVGASFSFDGSLYYCSAAMGVEAALVILGSEQSPCHDIGGGVLTPATLGMLFVERLREIGAVVETKMLTQTDL